MIIMLYLGILISTSVSLNFLNRSKYTKKIRMSLIKYILLMIFILGVFNIFASICAIKLITGRYVASVYYYIVQYLFCLLVNIFIIDGFNRIIAKYYVYNQRIKENKDEFNMYIKSIKSKNIYTCYNDNTIRNLINKIISDFKCIIKYKPSFKIISIGYMKSIDNLIDIASKEENIDNEYFLKDLKESLYNIINTIDKIKSDIYKEKTAEFNLELDNLIKITSVFKKEV